MRYIYQVVMDRGEFEPERFSSPCSSPESALGLALKWRSNPGDFWDKMYLQRYESDSDGVYKQRGYAELWCWHCDIHSYDDRDVELSWIRVGCDVGCFEDQLNFEDDYEERELAMFREAVNGALLFSTDYNKEGK
jgi:hypothetical protein